MAPKTFQVEVVGMWIEFTSETGLLSSRGFYVTLKAEEEPATCEEDDFPCGFSRGKVCLHSDQECDGIPMCPGQKDETACIICGQRYITLKPGNLEYELQSNNYPQNYRNDIACIWRVTSHVGFAIRVDIMDFELERGYDRVIIGYGEYSTDKASRIADLTGIVKLRRLVSMQAKLWIQFNTDRTGTRRGFDMILSEINMSGNNDTICDEDHIDCGTGLCVDRTAACDGFNDCFNLQDEQNCGKQFRSFSDIFFLFNT
ncbi:enteropeptidase-like [Amphiura filiformis]|uniref:enteropeptidase-like n=1 Tax=Amphiura filiformis TaxID=82378 RepID=UPI003B21F7BE